MAPILLRGRRWVRVGRKIALATAACLNRCCLGCRLWSRVVRCDVGPTCFGEPSPFEERWICATVTCTDGTPLHAGSRFKLDGVCWTVAIEQVVELPKGAIVIDSKTPVECVASCFDERCPQGEQWLVSRPCVVGGTPVYVCGVLECGVYELPAPYGCSLIDPADGYIPGSALPPGAVTISAAGVPVRPTCCDCHDETGCVPSSPIGGIGNPPGACDQNPICVFQTDGCCCESEESGGFGRYRVVSASQTRRVFYDPGFGFDGAFYGYLGQEYIDETSGWFCYERFIRREGFGGPTETTRLSNFCPGIGCGFALSSFPGESPPFDPALGRWQCSDCPQQGISDVVLTGVVNCTTMRLFNTYTVTGDHFRETFELVLNVDVVGSRACAGGCAGRSRSSGSVVIANAGCKNCGKTIGI